MENFLSRLNRNPYAPIDGASVTKFDELGNGLDDWGNVIAPRFEAPEQTWGETALGVATAPARLATALAGSLSPYGADGWQVPPVAQEGWNALTAVGDAYNYGMSDEEINSRALGMAGFMMGGGGLAARPAGGTGMFAGRLAKTADQEALARAERLAAEGADRNAIWNETGWFQGPDHKWRFEIDDSGAYADVRGAVEDGWKANEQWPLGHVLGHKDAFSAYPYLDDAGIQYRPFPKKIENAFGAYVQDGNNLVLNSSHPNFIDDNAALSTILHEGQHSLQATEGFARGGSRALFTPEEIASERARIGAVPEDNTGRTSVGSAAGDAPDTDVALGLYKRLAGETEARNVQTRMNMTPEQRRATPPWETQDIPFEDQIVRLYSNASKEGALPALLAGQEAAPLRGYHGSMYPDYLDTAKKRGEFWAASDPSYDGIPVNSANPERLYSFFEGSTGQTAYPSMTPVEMQFKNALVAGGDSPSPWTRVPFEGGQASTEDIVKLARERGNDGVIFKNLQESGPVSDEYVALGQGTVRSPLTGETLFSNADSKPALLAGALAQEQNVPGWLLPFLQGM